MSDHDTNGPSGPRQPSRRELRAARLRAYEQEGLQRKAGGGQGKGDKKKGGEGGDRPGDGRRR